MTEPFIPSQYQLPDILDDQNGARRTVGFELEFTGLSLKEVAAIIRKTFGGETIGETKAQEIISVDGLGNFAIELDWDFLKKEAKNYANSSHVGLLRDAASLIVPVEVVCPPVPISELATLDPLVSNLREAGARGTDESLVAAYGVHINTSLPGLEASTIDSYLKAFCVLQWWLVKKHAINLSRRLTPYIDIYPSSYLKKVISADSPSLQEILDSYLKHNATRNRALDMLPLFSYLDEQRVLTRVNDDRIKARPTFHYRLPNCLIADPIWSLAEPWNLWCVVEALANQPDDLNRLCGEFLEAWRPLLGVDQSHWIEKIDTWVKGKGLG